MGLAEALFLPELAKLTNVGNFLRDCSLYYSECNVNVEEFKFQ